MNEPFDSDRPDAKPTTPRFLTFQFLRAETNMKVYPDNCFYNRPFDDQEQGSDIGEVKI